MRVTKISCTLPVGVKFGGLWSGSGPWSAVLDQIVGPAIREHVNVKETKTSNRPLTLELEVPEGREASTVEALRELIKDLER